MIDDAVPVDDVPSISGNPPQAGNVENFLCERADGMATAIEGSSKATNPQKSRDARDYIPKQVDGTVTPAEEPFTSANPPRRQVTLAFT